MKRLIDFLGNKWVLGVIGLTALSLLIWFGAGFIKFGADNVTLSATARIMIIAVFWLIWLSWNISQLLVERRQNKELIGGIEESQEDAADPDAELSQEEQMAVAKRFQEALLTLKKSRFKSRYGSRSLYQLPWYIIIGPPGSGKTTALVNSGLEFPLAETHGKQALGGIGGTRNCDWWFTNEAVLIDTAGRYTTQDSHRVVDNNAWKSFLALLKKYRRRRPINGALVAISLQDLMVQTREQRLQQAKTIRSRINELQEELGVRFPVYLTFTKCDLVAGFSEFFANLSQAEREQVWGVSFPQEASEDTGADISSFRSELSQLIHRLNERLLWRVHQERNTDKRALIQGFPAHIESLTSVLDEFLEQTFAPNKYGAVPMLRGVYFTSATQEGSPIDRMMAQVSANFGLERSMAKQQHNSGKSFFITRLFRDVVFPESELVGVNRKTENILLWLRRGAQAALAALFVGSVTLWAAGLSQNKSYMSEVDALYAEHRQQLGQYDAERADMADVLKVIEPLRQAAGVYDQEEHPFINNLGLYDGRVDEAADSLYRNQLQEILQPALARMLERHLQTLSADDSALLPVFKAYLMMFDATHRDYQEIRSYAQTRWEDLFPGQASEQQRLLLNLDNLIQSGFAEDQNADEAVVFHARHQLKRITVAQRLYMQLQKMDNNAQLVDLYREIGGDTQRVFGISENDPLFRMPFLYTKAGYDNADYGPGSDMMKRIAEDRWIYGDDATGADYTRADLEKLSGEVEKLYLTDYAQRWQTFFRRFSLTPVRSVDQAVNLSLQLSDPVSSPLLHVAGLVAENTLLTPEVDVNIPAKAGKISKASGALEKAANTVREPTLVDETFRDVHRLVKSENNMPSKLHGYLGSIKQLGEYLAQINNAPDANGAAFEVAKASFMGSNAAPLQQLKNMATTAQDQAKGWLNDLADGSWVALMRKAKVHVDTVWRYQVYDNYRNNLYDRYPLSRGRQTEASVTAFNDFFKPGGIQQAFVNEYIAPFVDTFRWKPKSYAGVSLGLSADTLTQFRRADNIRRAYFAKGESAAVAFRAEPMRLSSSVRLFTLEVGSSRTTYSHGPRIADSMVWTAGEDSRARLIFEDLNENVNSEQYDGGWSFIRLLDDSGISATASSASRDLTFEKDGFNAIFRVTSATNINAFDLGLLRNYRCAEVL